MTALYWAALLAVIGGIWALIGALFDSLTVVVLGLLFIAFAAGLVVAG